MHKKIKNGKITWLAAFCMAVLLALGITAVPVYANEQTQTMKITSRQASAKKGETVSVDLVLSGNPGIWGLQFEVDYDHSVLSLESVTAGTVFSADELVLPETDNLKALNEKGQSYMFVAASSGAEDDSNNSTDGTLATLKFTVKDTAAKTDAGLTIRSVKAYKADEQKIDAKSISVFAGKVTVTDAAGGGDSGNQDDKKDDPDTGKKDDKKDNPDTGKNTEQGNAGTGSGSTGTGSGTTTVTDKKTQTGSTDTAKGNDAKTSGKKADSPDTSDTVKGKVAIGSVVILLLAGGLFAYYRRVVIPRRRRHTR